MAIVLIVLVCVCIRACVCLHVHSVYNTEILQKLAFQIGKLSGEIRDLRRLVERSAAVSHEDVPPIPELADGPVDQLDPGLVHRLGDKMAQHYVVNMKQSFILILIRRLILKLFTLNFFHMCKVYVFETHNPNFLHICN